jgi:hypothetical protein
MPARLTLESRRISPNIWLTPIDHVLLRFDRVGHQGFLLANGDAPAFVKGCQQMAQVLRRYEVLEEKSRALFGSSFLRLGICKGLCLECDLAANQIVIFDFEAEVLRIDSWELSALASGAQALLEELVDYWNPAT